IGPAWIGIEPVEFLHPSLVPVVNPEEPQRPIRGFERGFTLEKIEADGGIVEDRYGIRATEKLGAVRKRGTDAARGRDGARFEEGEVLREEVQEFILGAEDRHVALEQALLVRVPEPRR